MSFKLKQLSEWDLKNLRDFLNERDLSLPIDDSLNIWLAKEIEKTQRDKSKVFKKIEGAI